MTHNGYEGMTPEEFFAQATGDDDRYGRPVHDDYAAEAYQPPTRPARRRREPDFDDYYNEHDDAPRRRREAPAQPAPAQPGLDPNTAVTAALISRLVPDSQKTAPQLAPERRRGGKAKWVAALSVLAIGGAAYAFEHDTPLKHRTAPHTSPSPTPNHSSLPSRTTTGAGKPAAKPATFVPTATQCAPVAEVSLGQYGLSTPTTWYIKFPDNKNTFQFVGDATKNIFPTTMNGTAELTACITDTKVVKADAAQTKASHGQTQVFDINASKVSLSLDTTKVTPGFSTPTPDTTACYITNALNPGKQPIDCSKPPTLDKYPKAYTTPTAVDMSYIGGFLNEQAHTLAAYELDELSAILDKDYAKDLADIVIPAIRNQLYAEAQAKGIPQSAVTFNVNGQLPSLAKVYEDKNPLPKTTVIDKGKGTQRTLPVSRVFGLDEKDAVTSAITITAK